MTTAIKHPSAQQLADFALGRTSSALSVLIEAHIADCAECCAKLSDVPNDTLTDRLLHTETRDGADSGTKPVPPVPRPTTAEIPQELKEHPRYRVQKTLGIGGMGVVFQAQHRIMDRPVALKVIHRRLIDNSVAVQRFHLEVKTAARLQHPNIVTAFDAEQAGDLHYLVMEYVDGVSLDQLVARKGPLPIQQACQCVRQVALGLQHAFENGMVHRDIKPQNLMVTRKGQIKILDFGLARFASEQEAPLTGETTQANAGLTMAGSVLGTPDYIAPEQVRDARQADIRADLYSLGCTLYFLLTGQVPFPKGSVRQKLTAHLDSTPVLITTLRSEIPAEVVAVLHKLLAKLPGDRYQTPAEFVQAITPLCRAAAIPVVPPSEPFLEIPIVSTSPSVHDRLHRRRPVWGKWSPQVRLGLWAAAGGALTAALWMSLSNPWPPTKSGKKPGKNDLAASQSVSAAETAESPWSPPPFPDSSPPQNATSTTTAGLDPLSRVLIVLPFHNFWYDDFAPLKQKLTAAGFEVVIASSQTGMASPAPTSEGYKEEVKVKQTLRDVQGGDFGVVIVTGGDYSDLLPHTSAGKDLCRVLQEAQTQGRWVTSICAGNAVLAAHHVLHGQAAADSQYVTDEIRHKSGVHWQDQTLVYNAEHRIVTARDAGAAQEFAGKLVWLLNEDRRRTTE